MRGNFFYKKIGENIARLRKQKNLSQYQVSQMADIDRSYLAEIEEGKANPSLKFLLKLSKVFGVSINEILKGI